MKHMSIVSTSHSTELSLIEMGIYITNQSLSWTATSSKENEEHITTKAKRICTDKKYPPENKGEPLCRLI